MKKKKTFIVCVDGYTAPELQYYDEEKDDYYCMEFEGSGVIVWQGEACSEAEAIAKCEKTFVDPPEDYIQYEPCFSFYALELA